MIDSFFDLDNFDKPVQTYLTQKYFYYMVADRREDVEIYIKQNQIKRLDDYTYLKGVKDNIFYTIKDQKQNSYDTGSLIYSSFSIYLDPEVQYYSRNVYTILDFFSQVGGIFSLLSSLCGLLIGFYSERMIYYTILSKCYSFDTEIMNKTEREKQEIVTSRKSVYIRNPTTRMFHEDIKENNENNNVKIKENEDNEEIQEFEGGKQNIQSTHNIEKPSSGYFKFKQKN